jgi:uncharacterized protein YjbI with pentapeptide repeats
VLLNTDLRGAVLTDTRLEDAQIEANELEAEEAAADLREAG